eukprot:COSAG02_NODE_30_length_50867_cov_66.594331_51_plen_130_part_00
MAPTASSYGSLRPGFDLRTLRHGCTADPCDRVATNARSGVPQMQGKEEDDLIADHTSNRTTCGHSTLLDYRANALVHKSLCGNLRSRGLCLLAPARASMVHAQSDVPRETVPARPPRTAVSCASVESGT